MLRVHHSLPSLRYVRQAKCPAPRNHPNFGDTRVIKIRLRYIDCDNRTRDRPARRGVLTAQASAGRKGWPCVLMTRANARLVYSNNQLSNSNQQAGHRCAFWQLCFMSGVLNTKAPGVFTGSNGTVHFMQGIFDITYTAAVAGGLRPRRGQRKPYAPG